MKKQTKLKGYYILFDGLGTGMLVHGTPKPERFNNYYDCWRVGLIMAMKVSKRFATEKGAQNYLDRYTRANEKDF